MQRLAEDGVLEPTRPGDMCRYHNSAAPKISRNLGQRFLLYTRSYVEQ